MNSSLEHFLSSELSRNSAKVFSAAEDAPVLVTRRDGENLVLMSESEANSRRELLEFAAQMIAVTTDEHGTLTERMADRFHWMLAFEEGVRDRCAEELVEAARASFATNQAHRAIATLVAWKDSAESIAAGRGSTQIDWLETPVPVKLPR